MKNLFSKRSNRQDLATQEVLYRQFYRMVYRTAFRYCGDESAAQDVVHETFIRAFRYIESYKEKESGSFEGWLVTIARNESLKYLKKSWQRNEILVDEIKDDREYFHYGDMDSMENQVLEKIKIEDLISAIEHTALRYRQILLLRLFHEYSFKEIGEILGIQENAARQLYYRAKRELLVVLEGKWGVNDER